MNKIELSVVIPVYNEQEIIKHVIGDWDKTLKELVINYEINVYNDGSKDKTLEELHSISDQYVNLKIHDKSNSGHGSTILKGYRESSNADWIFQLDSDNEISAQFFKDFWTVKDDYDFIIGTRDHHNRPKVRDIISFISRLLIIIFYGGNIKDVNVPYRLMRTERFSDFYRDIPAGTFAPNVIISGCAAKKKLRIKQIPIYSSMRETGEVSIKKWKLFKVAFKSFVQTINFRFSI